MTQTCQMCLSGATGNDCSAQAKTMRQRCKIVSRSTHASTSVRTSTRGAFRTAKTRLLRIRSMNGAVGLLARATDCSAQCSACSGGGSSGGGGSGSSSGGGGSSSGGGSGSSSGNSGPVTCQVDDSGQYFSCQGNQDGYYCTGSDTPLTDGFSKSCGSSAPEPSGTGLDYCCE